VLFVLYLFRIAAIATYILCGFFTDNYVVSVRLNVPISSSNKSFISSHLQTVIVVILLAMDFWNCRVGSVRASLFYFPAHCTHRYRTLLDGLSSVYGFGIRSGILHVSASLLQNLDVDCRTGG
jgi:hypothetical protein